ncbi:MAG: 50S ribosomal protein L23 [Gemmatimonadetes bacterium]|nr:50S ribosomal protein L23 [Gemmatimonadota bacterium]
MRDPREVMLRPLVTERSTAQIERDNVYTFIVNPDANKVEIARAVEQLWGVRVLAVNTMRYPGKARRGHMGLMSRGAREVGRRPAFKKALVRLAQGDKIELYEVG